MEETPVRQYDVLGIQQACGGIKVINRKLFSPQPFVVFPDKPTVQTLTALIKNNHKHFFSVKVTEDPTYFRNVLHVITKRCFEMMNDL